MLFVIEEPNAIFVINIMKRIAIKYVFQNVEMGIHYHPMRIVIYSKVPIKIMMGVLIHAK